MGNAYEHFLSLPSRLLLDTCILNLLFNESEYIWEGVFPDGVGEDALNPDLVALRAIFQVNERATFQFLVSPLTIAEVANIQDFPDREIRLRWVLDVLDHWLILLDEIGNRAHRGGTVRHRFKLSPELQELESRLMEIPDFQRDPLDRLLLLQSKMANSDAFLTVDKHTIWRNREALDSLKLRVLCPV
ncbi:MAG: hypothetical protein LAN71_18010 [Acidobacteriia bacterium]|nr:hypothetical protein [Terriglobia bacterium]